jgi:hypothetical protein
VASKADISECVLLWIPEKWNQAAYDLFTLKFSKGDTEEIFVEVTFYQGTTAKKHVLKSEYLPPVYDTINEICGMTVKTTGYKVCFVAPEGYGFTGVPEVCGIHAPIVTTLQRWYRSEFSAE